MVKIQIHPQGTRVRVQRGSFPLDPSLEGRTGLVVDLRRRGRYGTDKYGVQLDGETRLRVFAEEELEPLTPADDPRTAGLTRAEGGSDAPK